MVSSIDVNKGEIKKSAKYKWQLGHCLGKGTCSVVVEAVGTFYSRSICRHSPPRVLKGAVKIFKQGHQFEQAATNEIEILEYLNRQQESPYKHYIGELQVWYELKLIIKPQVLKGRYLLDRCGQISLFTQPISSVPRNSLLIMLYYGEIHVVLLWVVVGLRLLLVEMREKTYVMHDTYDENDKKAENAPSSVK